MFIIFLTLPCFQAVVAALFMNIYIVGLNQLSDIDIDKVSFVNESYWQSIAMNVVINK